MKQSSVEHWSLARSLAFLAATFAIVLATFLPSAVAASAATGSPVVLCSGEMMIVSYDEDGAARAKKPSAMDSLKCASCVLAALTTLPPPPPVRPFNPPHIVAVQPVAVSISTAPPVFRIDWRPPATAPPAA